MTKSNTNQPDLPKIIANIIKPIVIANLYNWKISKLESSPIQTLPVPIKPDVIKANVTKAAEALEQSHLKAGLKRYVLATFTDLLSQPCQSCASLKDFVPNKPMQTMSNICDLKVLVAKQHWSNWDKKGELDKLVQFSVKNFGGIWNFKFSVHEKNLNTLLANEPQPNSMTKSLPLPSTSKILSFAYPDQCFIYDSRVSIALNAIMEQEKIPLDHKKYPLIMGKNSKTSSAVLDHFKLPKADSVDAPTMYMPYCDLILKTAKHLDNCNPQMVEMALFLLGKGVRDCIYADTAK